jgi:hypothetical protein
MSRIHADPDFEPRIADWLEADPDHAPGALLGTVLAALPSISQRRASRVLWRFPTMNRFALLGAAAATIAVVGLGGLELASRSSSPQTIAGQTATPSPSPTASATVAATGAPTPVADSSPEIPPLTEQLISGARRFTIDYPRGWTPVSSTRVEWRADSTHVNAVFSGWSVQLPNGQSAAEWLATQESPGQDEACPPASDPPEIMIGGHVGVLLSSDCWILGGRRHYLAAVVAGGRGYTFHMDTTRLDQTWFEALLANVSLDP